MYICILIYIYIYMYVYGRKLRRFTSEEEAWYFKDMIGILPGLARIEGVGGPAGGACIADSRPVFRRTNIFRHCFYKMFFDSFLGGFSIDFGASCASILAFKTEQNRSRGPSWRILAAFWALIWVLFTQESASTRQS